MCLKLTGSTGRCSLRAGEEGMSQKKYIARSGRVTARPDEGSAKDAGAALQCYSCTAQVSNRDCLNVKNCTAGQTQCWTDRIRAAGLVTLISKGCSSDCVDDAENYYVGRKNLTCCSTDLCNVSGAHSLRSATAQGLLTALASLLFWGPGRL